MPSADDPKRAEILALLAHINKLTEALSHAQLGSTEARQLAKRIHAEIHVAREKLKPVTDSEAVKVVTANDKPRQKPRADR